MFFNRRERKIEEYQYRQICHRVYFLIPIVYREGLRNAVQINNKLSYVDPWKKDMDLLREMEKSFKHLDSRSFLNKYGVKLREMEDYYL